MYPEYATYEYRASLRNVKKQIMMKQAYIYMIRCEDDSIYTGIAANLTKRLSQHYNREKECAKYMKSHRMKRLEMAFLVEDLSVAAKYEYRIKRLKKQEKEKLIIHPESLFALFADKLEEYAVDCLKDEDIRKINQAVCVSCKG